MIMLKMRFVILVVVEDKERGRRTRGGDSIEERGDHHTPVPMKVGIVGR